MGLLKDWADRWLHHRTAEAGTLPVSADNENQRMSAVATDEGVLLFSDSVKGMKARTTYLQHLADGFFNFSKKVETLKLYEIEIPMRQMVELADNCIDKLSKADLRRDDIQLRKSVCSFTPEKMSGKEMLVGAVCTGKYDLRPDFNNFDRLTKDFDLGISPRNYDVAALLYISENGYAGLMEADHFHPFSYQYEFKERDGKPRSRHTTSAMRPCRWKPKQWRGTSCNRSSTLQTGSSGWAEKRIGHHKGQKLRKSVRFNSPKSRNWKNRGVRQ